MKDLGPSSELRKWFDHQTDRWTGFAQRYRHELTTPLRQLLLTEIQGLAQGSTITLVYGARNTKENEAVVLRQYVLTDMPHPDSTWDASTRLLITTSVVAAAHHDAVAPASSVRRFASAILTAQNIDGAFKDLLTSGMLRQSSGGWRMTPRGIKQVRQQASMGSITGTP